jgi:hypothetical protein
MRPKSSCSSCRINKKKCVFVFPNSCERCVKYHLSCDRSFQSRSSRKNDQNIEDEDEKETSSDCKVAAKSNDSKFLIQDILKKERNEDEKETSSDCKVAAKSNDSKFLSQENSKKDNNKDEKETLSDCKVAAKSNDSELTGPEDHNKDTMELQERLSYISPHHEHQGLDLKFDTVSSVNEDNVDRTVTFYSRGQRKLFHIGSSATLIEELVTSRIKMSYDGPVSFLQCTSLPFNRTKLNGAFLVFRKKHAQAWRLGFVTKFGYDANAADEHKVSLYEWVGRVSICGEPDLFHCKSWNDMLSHLTLVTYSVDDLNGYFVNQVNSVVCFPIVIVKSFHTEYFFPSSFL